MAIFLVHVIRSGSEWDPTKPLREQSGWDAHAAFMNGLVDHGFVVLGGPLDERRVAHAVKADSEDEIRATFGRDPWSGSHLEIESIEPWTILLDAREQ